jgi:hypothetical protein
MDLDSTPPTTPAGAGALVAYVLADSNGCSKMLIWHEWALYNVAEALKDMTPGSRLILEADDD